MADLVKTIIESLKDGYWLILSKNSLFWKARLDPSEEVKGKSILSISYGKSLSKALKAETSQAVEHDNRERALKALAKLLKEKTKNGYSVYSPSEDKENRFDRKAGKASPIPIKGGKIDVEAIEHQCQHIPLILTEDFEEKSMIRTAEKLRDQGDANLGKRQKTTEAKKRTDEADINHPTAMSLNEILNKSSNSKKPSSKNATAKKEPEAQQIESTPMKEEKIAKSSSKNNSDKSKSVKKGGSQLKQASESEEDKINETLNQLFEKKVTGSDLYGVRNNTKHFTSQIIVQVLDNWAYLEFNVAEDMSLNKKLLLKWSSNEDAIAAANKQVEELEQSGYKLSQTEPPGLITTGIISTLSQKRQVFQDCSELHFSQITDASQQLLGSHNEEDEEVIEEKTTQKQIVASNLEFDQFSHSVHSLNDANVKELEIKPQEVEEKKEKFQEYERFQNESEKGTLAPPSNHVHPLGAASTGMIGLMLLNNFKNMDVSSKIVITRLAYV